MVLLQEASHSLRIGSPIEGFLQAIFSSFSSFCYCYWSFLFFCWCDDLNAFLISSRNSGVGTRNSGVGTGESGLGRRDLADWMMAISRQDLTPPLHPPHYVAKKARAACNVHPAIESERKCLHVLNGTLSLGDSGFGTQD